MRDRKAATARRVALKLLGALLAVTGATANAADIKIATVAPDGSRWMQQMRAGAEEVKARTAGRVTLKFYPGGVMGNDAQVLRKIRIGQLQGGAFTAGGLAERYPGLNLYGIPLLFRSLDEVDAVRAALDPELAAGLERAGFVTFGFIEGGFANLLSNEPIRTVVSVTISCICAFVKGSRCPPIYTSASRAIAPFKLTMVPAVEP